MFKLLEPLPEEEQNHLLSERGNPENKEKLILHNLKLIYWVIRRYYPREKRLEEDDLFQEGVIGLINAIDRYDKDKGTFGNFAVWDIRGSIQRALENKADVIRIPSYLRQTLVTLEATINNLESKLYREPTDLEIASSMGISEREVTRLKNIIKEPISLNYPINSDGETLTLEDSIRDPSSPGYDEVEDRVYIQDFKNKVKCYLSDIEYKTLTLYYGLDSPKYYIGEIAKGLKEEPKKVSAVRAEALRKLRRSKVIAEIKRELDDNTIFISGIDYSKPRVIGGEVSSPVERIVLQREKMQRNLLRNKEVL